MKDKEILFNNDVSVTLSELTYKKIWLQLSELRKKERNIACAIEYLEKNRIRNKAIIDVDALEGILNEL